ncbi:hypothetical protein [Burkholderia seminalis]|uniref:hypothetical protein n=1 Tax=Burkholderia seminalis TaxID=488731 RepID=UPI00114CFB46|nr:hypothetical protein [Burkholderia seminalis]
MGLPIAQAYGKAGNAISPSRRHDIGVGVHGRNIDKNSQRVPEDFNHLHQAFNVGRGAFSCRRALQLHHCKVPFVGRVMPTRIKWLVNDDIGPDCEPMRSKELLIFLFDDGPSGEEVLGKCSSERDQQFTLKATLGLVEAWCCDGLQCGRQMLKEYCAIHGYEIWLLLR